MTRSSVTVGRRQPRGLFRDRREAGRELAGLLTSYRGRSDVIVLGLARGGVSVALEVAAALGAPLDAYVVRKLGAPGPTRSSPSVPRPVVAASSSMTMSCAVSA